MINKILIITNLEHSAPRIPNLLKYLNKKKWSVTVVCPPQNKKYEFGHNLDFDCSNINLVTAGKYYCSRSTNSAGINTARKILSKNKVLFNLGAYLYTQYVSIRYYPDRDKVWRNKAITTISELMEKETFDLILSSSSPITTHIIAKEIKDKYEIPWIAELRDLWTKNHNYPYNKIRKLFERKLEKSILSNANSLIMVTEPCEELMKKDYVVPCTTITNGYDPDKYKKEYIGNGELIIRYTGNIYYKSQSPRKFMFALNKFLELHPYARPNLEVHFYGYIKEWLQVIIDSLNLQDVVSQKGLLSRDECYELQTTADLLLLFNWEISDNVALPLKTLEYFGAKRPILATGGKDNDFIKKIIKKTNSGFFCTTTDLIVEHLSKFYDEYKTRGKIRYNGIDKELEKYSYISTTEKFEKKFLKVIKEGSGLVGNTNK